MSTESKKHHYVPQSVLRRFSIDGAGKQIFVFDKCRGAAYRSAIRDAGAENQFNTIEIGGQLASFEALFQNTDDRLAVLLARITTERSLVTLGPPERRDLADAVAVQLVRTKLLWTSMRTIAEDLARSLSEAGLDAGEIANFGIPTEQDVKQAALELFADRDRFRDALVKKHLVLVEATEADLFWISDNPVVLHNTFPYGETGLEARGIEVYFPVATDLALAFFCPSIELKLKYGLALPDSALPAEKRERFAELHRAMLSGQPTSLGPGAVRFLNALQISRSSRFLYAATDEFRLAEEILDARPELRDVRTHIRAGRIGGGPPPKPRMPPGVWLVVYGRLGHHMLRVEDWDESSRFIEFSTPDFAILDAVLQDEPLEQAVLFQDGAERRGMREIKIDVIGNANQRRIRIVHRDDGLNKVLIGFP